MNNGEDTIKAARELLSEAFSGVLSTHSTEFPDYPFGSVVPYTLGRDGWPIILISHLARHTKNLNASPQCCMTISEQGDADIQKLLRLACLADAEPYAEIEAAQSERHFRYFPDNRNYHEELNFLFYRLIPKKFYCVGGFGTARWIGVDQLAAPNRFSFAEENEYLEQINRDLKHLLPHLLFGRSNDGMYEAPPFRAIGLDQNGLDLIQNQHLFRRVFSKEVTDFKGIEDQINNSKTVYDIS